MKPTMESKVKRDLKTPKYRCRVVESKRENLEEQLDWEISEEDIDTNFQVCDHNYLSNCPFNCHENCK